MQNLYCVESPLALTTIYIPLGNTLEVTETIQKEYLVRLTTWRHRISYDSLVIFRCFGQIFLSRSIILNCFEID